MQRQLEAASASHVSTQQQLHDAQAQVMDCKQQLIDVRALLASRNTAHESSTQSIAALQEGTSRHMAALTAFEARIQALLTALDQKDEQLKQMTDKLHAAEHAAVSAQGAANRLQARLAGQNAEATGQSQELTQALELGSVTVHQLELTMHALQEKVFAADHVVKRQQEQLLGQQASSLSTVKHAEQLAQQLSSKDTFISSLQAALKTATFVAESNQQLVSNLQVTHSSAQVDTHVHVNSLVAQLQSQASTVGEMLTELSKAQGKLSLADQAIAAAHEHTDTSRFEQSKLAAKVSHLVQLLESKERQDWLAMQAEVSCWPLSDVECCLLSSDILIAMSQAFDRSS